MSDELWSDSVLLPYRPRATDRLAAGQYRMHRDAALTHRYIEHSPYALLGSIVVDVDHHDSAIRAFQRPSDHPQPNWVAQSPSGRGHVGWWLSAPVCRTDSARLQPLRFAQRVERGLVTSLGGDLAYGGQLTKNPIHDSWETVYGPAAPYTLAQLVTVHTPRQMPRRPDRAAGLGRNVTLFDVARAYAYSAWWANRTGTARDWDHLVVQRCQEINGEFGSALPFAEVQAVARSVGRWVWRNFNEDAYRARQSRLGRIVTEKKRASNAAHGFQPTVDRTAMLGLAL